MTLGEIWNHFVELRSRVDELFRRAPQVDGGGGRGTDGTDGTDGGGSGCSITAGSTTTLGSSGEGDESPAGDSWEAGGTDQANVWMQSRTGYFSAGDKKLYGYARMWTISPCGKVESIGNEVRYEIDNPTLCPEDAPP